MKRLFTFIFFVFFVPLAYAKTQHLDIMIEDIISSTKLHQTPQHELYVNVTEHWSTGHSKSNCFPEAPVHWKLVSPSKIKSTVLWHGALKEGQSTRVIMTFIDQVAPTTEPGDLMGIVTLYAENRQGVIKYHWSVDEGTVRPLQTNRPAKEAKRFFLTGGMNTTAVDLLLLGR